MSQGKRAEDLKDTILIDANLSAIDLSFQDFGSADLTGAILNGTNLYGSDLSKTKGLTKKQLREAIFVAPDGRSLIYDGVALQLRNESMIELKPDHPEPGHLIECLNDNVTDKAPCSGHVIGRAVDGTIAVSWSDTIELLKINWSGVECRPTHDGRELWLIK